MARHLSLTRLPRDRRGASVVELGLVLPILSVMLFGLVDVASCYSAQMSLQQAAARSLERVHVTGYGTNFNYVQTEAAAAATAAGFPAAQVQVTTWLECDYVKQGTAVTSCTGTQAAGRYVQVTITANYTPFFPYSPLGQRQADGTRRLTTSSSVRYL